MDAKKPVPIDPETGQPVEDYEPPIPLKEHLNDMYTRVQDDEDHINEELMNYGSQRSAMEDFLMKLYNDQYIKIDAAGKTP